VFYDRAVSRPALFCRTERRLRSAPGDPSLVASHRAVVALRDSGLGEILFSVIGSGAVVECAAWVVGKQGVFVFWGLGVLLTPLRWWG